MGLISRVSSRTYRNLTTAKMTNAHGKRRGTRYMFSKEFRNKGMPGLATYMHVYKRGDIVDIIAKRINLRVEHVKHSKSRLGFINRVHKNEETRKANLKSDNKPVLKRIPVQPRKAHVVKAKKAGEEFVAPIPYEFII